MKVKRLALVLSTIAALNLSVAPKASAFDLGGFIGGAIGSLGDLGFLSPELLDSLNLYTKFGEALLEFIDTKSIDALTAILPDILGQLSGVNGLAECSSEGANCAGLLGEAGLVDWELASESIADAVQSATAESDAGYASVDGSGPISSGVTDKRFRPRITTQINNAKIASWTQLQDAQMKVVLSEDGQKFIQEGRDAAAEIVKESAKTTEEVAKLDNTQDILKKAEVNKTLAIAFQQRQLEEQTQTRIATYEGNQTKTQQLTIQQKQDWMKEVERSQAMQSAHIEGQAFSDFIGSAYTDPGQTAQ